MVIYLLPLLNLFLVHRWNTVSLSIFYIYYFCTCKSQLSELVSLPHSHGRSTCYFNSLHNFSVIIISRYYKDMHVNCFFPRTGRLWNSLFAECFPLNYGSVELILTFYLWVLSKPLSYTIAIIFFSLFL